MRMLVAVKEMDVNAEKRHGHINEHQLIALACGKPHRGSPHMRSVHVLRVWCCCFCSVGGPACGIACSTGGRSLGAGGRVMVK